MPSQFWCGEWIVCGTQPPGPSGQPWLWSAPTNQFPPQPAAGILPLPLGLWLWPFTQRSLQKLLHCQWPVSAWAETVSLCWEVLKKIPSGKSTALSPHERFTFSNLPKKNLKTASCAWTTVVKSFSPSVPFYPQGIPLGLHTCFHVLLYLSELRGSGM